MYINEKKHILFILILFIFTLFFSLFFRRDISLNEKQSEIIKLYYSLPDYDNELIMKLIGNRKLYLRILHIRLKEILPMKLKNILCI